MNAIRWETSNDPWDMLGWRVGDCSVRQQGLWAVACCRRIWNTLPPACHEVLETIEVSLERTDHLVGLIDRTRWEAVFDRIRDFDHGIRAVWSATFTGLYKSAAGEVADSIARLETGFTGQRDWPREYRAVWRREQAVHARLLREVCGSPYRPVAFSSVWRTSDVELLAQHIYDTRDFTAIPVLADALQDAGCDSSALLTHLRDSHTTHVRGCWALDLVLGKL